MQLKTDSSGSGSTISCLCTHCTVLTYCLLLAGTLQYMAPEVIDRGLRGYSYPVSPCSLAGTTVLADVISIDSVYIEEF